MEGATSFNQASVGIKMIIELNNTSGAVRLDFRETKFRSESRSYTSVSPSVVATTTTLQNFALASFWSLPANHP